MHSSRMRTVRCSSRLLKGCLPGGLSVRGVCPGVRGGLSRGCLPKCMLGYTPPPVDRMTDRCKTLPCRNYVADGNNDHNAVALRTDFCFRNFFALTHLTPTSVRAIQKQSIRAQFLFYILRNAALSPKNLLKCFIRKIFCTLVLTHDNTLVRSASTRR